MRFLETEHQKKSFTITSVLIGALFLILFYIGLHYLDPPVEKGIAINFGFTNLESGGLSNAPQKQSNNLTTKMAEQSTSSSAASTEVEAAAEKVLTSDQSDLAVTPTVQEEKVIKPVKEDEGEQKIEPPKPSKSTKDALSSILGAPKQDGKDEDIASQKSGNGNSEEGDPYASTSYGTPGNTGNSLGFGLNGRSLVSRGKVKQNCNEEGKVVVRIVVDKTGKVVKTTPGVQGTTNNAPCLLEPARKTAELHKWNLDSNAPAQQIGFVVVNFKLGK